MHHAVLNDDGHEAEDEPVRDARHDADRLVKREAEQRRQLAIRRAQRVVEPRLAVSNCEHGDERRRERGHAAQLGAQPPRKRARRADLRPVDVGRRGRRLLRAAAVRGLKGEAASEVACMAELSASHFLKRDHGVSRRAEGVRALRGLVEARELRLTCEWLGEAIVNL